MNENRTFTKTWRWSVLVMLGMAVVWLPDYLLTGKMPAATTVNFWWFDPIFRLDTPVSRLWDLVAVPAWIAILIYGLDHIRYHQSIRYFLDETGVLVWLLTAASLAVTIFEGFLSGLVSILVTLVFVGVAFSFWRWLNAVVDWANAKN